MLNTTSSSIADKPLQYFNIIYYLNTIVPLIWLVIGTITNLISLAVFSRRTMRHNSTFIYLAIMSFSDIVTLWTSSFRDYLAYKFNLYINGDYPCKFHTFTFFVFAQFSSWLLVGANLDRLICVISLSKYSQSWCSKRTAIKFAIILFAFLAIINSHLLVFIKSIDNNFDYSNVTVNPFVYPKCVLKNDLIYIYFYNNIFTWIDTCLYCLLPFLIMLICNITLIQHVFKTKNNLFQKQSFNKKPKYSILSLYKASRPSLFTSQCSVKTNVSKFKKIYKPIDSIERMRNMAVTIIGVTFLFIIFTVPINIFIPVTMAMNKHGETEDLIFSILNNTVNANHSINFFIYYLTNSKFNLELKTFAFNFKKDLFIFFGIQPSGGSFTQIQTNLTSNHNCNITTNLNTNTKTNLSHLAISNVPSAIVSKVHFSNVSSEPSFQMKSSLSLENDVFKIITENISDDIDAPLAFT